MNAQPARCLLIDAIIGKGFVSTQQACVMTEKGLAVFTGNQWNEDWGWKRDALEKLTTEELVKLYDATEADYPIPPYVPTPSKYPGTVAQQMQAEIDNKMLSTLTKESP